MFKQFIEILKFRRPCFQGCDLIQTAQCAVQRDILFFCESRQFIQRGFANTPFGYIDDTSQGDGIRRVRHHFQIRQDVADFLSFIKTYAAKEAIRDALFHHLVFHRTGLGVGSVKHSHFVSGSALLFQLLNLFRYEAAFIVFVICFVYM